MEFASKHVYLGTDEEEIDEGILEAVSGSGGLSNVMNMPQQQQVAKLEEGELSEAGLDSGSASEGTDASDDEPSAASSSVSSNAKQSNDAAPQSKEKKQGFFSKLFARKSASSSSSSAAPASENKPRKPKLRAVPQQQQQQQAPIQNHQANSFFSFLQGSSNASPPPPPPMAPSPHMGGLPPPPPSSSAPGYGGKPRRTYKRAIDTNLLAVKFNTLSKNADELFAGDVILCQGCQAALNHLSILLDHECKRVRPAPQASSSSASSVAPGGCAIPNQVQHAPMEVVVEEAAQALPNDVHLEPNQIFWACEFCGHHNILSDLQPAEIPQTQSRDYVLEPAPDASSGSDTADEGIVLFVLDISGSMCVSAPVAGKIKLRGVKAIDPSLLAFGDVDMSGVNGNVTYISRLQSVQASIEQQLTNLAKSHPNKKIGLITFNSEVTIIGDGTAAPITIAGDKLLNHGELTSIGKDYNIQQPVSQSCEKLTSALFSLEETGPTALGPALVTAIALASQKRGSNIIVCTDGLANVGLGNMTDKSKSEEEISAWYQAQGALAKAAGVTVNIVSIKGDECNLSMVGLVAAESEGQVERVDPSNIANEFKNMLANPIIATNVKCTFFLHKGMQFRGEDAVQQQAEAEKAKILPVVEENEAAMNIEPPKPKSVLTTKLTRDVGNVYSDSETSLDYGLRSGAELAQYAHLKSLPFQVQIEFTTLAGMKALRVLTQAQEVTLDRAVAEKDVKLELLSAQIAQKSANLARKGQYHEARLNWVSAAPMLSRAAQTPQQRQTFSNYAQNIDVFDRAMAQQERLEEQAELENEQDQAMNASALGSSGSAAPSAAKKKSKVSDETYRHIHKTCQLRSAGLL